MMFVTLHLAGRENGITDRFVIRDFQNKCAFCGFVLERVSRLCEMKHQQCKGVTIRQY